MLSVVVLFTVFLGLVGVLVLLSELQRMWLNLHDSQILWGRVEDWLERNSVHLPTQEDVIHVFKDSLHTWTHEQGNTSEELSLRELLPGTESPLFIVTKIVSSKDRSIVFNCDIEWPMCVPGLAVSVIPLGKTTPVICHLQVEWLYAHARLTLTQEGGELLVSFDHTQPPIMGISCGVLNQQLENKTSTKLVSSVADGMQRMFSELSLKNVAMTGVVNHIKVVPLVFVSGPEDSEAGNRLATDPTLEQTVEVAETKVTETKVAETKVTETKVAETKVADSESKPHQDGETKRVETVLAAPAEPDREVTLVTEDAVAEQLLKLEPMEAELLPPFEVIVKETDVHEVKDEDHFEPSSPGWRRSSSYEQLADTLFQSPMLSESTEILSCSNLNRVSPEAKALTLSMAGSESESLYGADKRIPSTLIFEVKDSIKTRHIVAQSITHASKLRKHFVNAQKLHIYNDHSFVASHIKERMLCAVCSNKIIGIFGKQAYLCRDCGLLAHKQCHFKTETLCRCSKVPLMNLVYPSRLSPSLSINDSATFGNPKTL